MVAPITLNATFGFVNDTTTEQSSTSLTVGIVGCGPAGMFFLRQLEKERERLLELKGKMEAEQQHGGEEDGTCNGTCTDSDADAIRRRLSSLPHVTVFEKESRCGGLWQSKLSSSYSSSSSKQEIPSDDFEGMYDGMWINAPKEVFEFEDYTFDEHFGKPMPSFLTRRQVLGYLEGATDDALNKYKPKQSDGENNDDNNDDRPGSILFNTEVSWISYDPDQQSFFVETVSARTRPTVYNEQEQYYDHDPEVLPMHRFDKIIFATGTENIPVIPQRELQLLKQGEITFDRPVLHSSQIKSLGADIAGKNFLFIGAAYSAEDLALSFLKRGANHIYVTTRSDEGYPVIYTGYWPGDRLTVLMRNEIKEVLPGNRLRMGRRNLTSAVQREIAKEYYNAFHDSFVLDDIDAVVFCTGYYENQDILDTDLKTYATHDGIDYNTHLKMDHVSDDHWPNIYDPEIFDAELPSDKEQNSCGSIIKEHSAVVRANPTKSIKLMNDGTYNGHLINNPGLFFHLATFDTPLLDLDIHSAYILKVILGDIPTPSTKDEMFRLRSLEMANMLRHSVHLRCDFDPIFYDASLVEAYRKGYLDEYDKICSYPLAYSLFKLFLKARKAGHAAGSMIVEKDLHPPTRHPPLNHHGCDLPTIEFEEGNYHQTSDEDDSETVPPPTKWVFSDRGISFLKQYLDFIESHDGMSMGSNMTFRDVHYDSYQSTYTGTKSRPFSKLWMEVDDIFGDVDVDVEDRVASPTSAESSGDEHKSAAGACGDTVGGIDCIEL
mmetsp:Transcript_18729/g.52351  ORF Transcript_18729/g.52351 Transcript_18729/m.52351 type:complete len:774 (+) Transcript_18729:153-2474(+)